MVQNAWLSGEAWSQKDEVGENWDSDESRHTGIISVAFVQRWIHAKMEKKLPPVQTCSIAGNHPSFSIKKGSMSAMVYLPINLP